MFCQFISSNTYEYQRINAFLEVKRPGRGVGHPLPSNTEVKERVQLYLYSPRAFMASSRVDFTFFTFTRKLLNSRLFILF